MASNPASFMIFLVLELIALAMALGGTWLAWIYMNSPEVDPEASNIVNFISSPGFYMMLPGFVGYHFLRKEHKRRKKRAREERTR